MEKNRKPYSKAAIRVLEIQGRQELMASSTDITVHTSGLGSDMGYSLMGASAGDAW
ncbi:MAG: hypothetical protein IJ762_10260 [Bacteroidaceae bacterium]|nr:hypothetical protein [Bacteroidaceae bacterium]